MKLINLSIIKNDIIKQENSRDFYLYYVLRGHARIEINNKVLPLESTEVIVINPDETYTIHCDNGILVECRISHSEVLRLMGHQRKMIVCYTHQINNKNTEELKRTLNGLLRSYYESGQNRIVQEQYSLSLVYILITNFANNIFDHTDDSRKNEIALYIEANYAEELTLDMIADEFALTPQYFSRYFKNEFQMPFLKYLNQVRLRYATEDLLSTDETILRIAIDNGFANIASFNREFNEMYHMTPGAYRQIHKTKQQEIHQEDILSYLEEDKKEEKGNIVQIHVAPKDSYPPFEKYWTEILNAGSFETMMKSNMNDQISYLKETLKFKRARLTLDTYSEDGNHHYYTADRVVEFFVKIHMDLMIVIDYRSIKNEDSFIPYFQKQCRRFVNRFGNSIRNHTIFEIDYNTRYDNKKLKSYTSFYRKIKAILKECSFNSEIIGPGILVSEDPENFRGFVKANPDMHMFTIICAPYAFHEKGNEIFINRLTDAGYVLEQYQRAKRILQEEGRDTDSVLITSWKDRINDVDVLNETPWMGARIIRNVLAGYGICSSLPIDIPLDLMFDEIAYDKTFNLLPGVMTSTGIRKPSWHALKLLDQQDELLVAISEDYLITKSKEPGFIQILVHNCKKPGYKYYAKDILNQIEDYQPELFEDDIPKSFEIHIEKLPPGDYILKTRTVNDENGCAFGRYLNMHYNDDSFIGSGESEYLEAASVLPVTGEMIKVSKSGILDLKVSLKMNEFKHLHLIKTKDNF